MVFAHCPYVTTFIRGLNRKLPLSANLAQLLCDAWGGGSHWQWLYKDWAFDVYHQQPYADEDDWRELWADMHGEEIDVIFQTTAHRRKKLLMADMDSTLIEQECIDELADYRGIKPQIAKITKRTMNGQLAFEERAARAGGAT
jgi:Phosphoserine phosphatase